MSSTELWVIGALVCVLPVVVVVGLGLVAIFSKQGRAANAFVWASERRIGDLEPGRRARVRGTVQVGAGGTVSAPLSGREVVAYQVTIRLSGAGDLDSTETLAEERAVGFRLEDATGAVEVDAARVTLLLEEEPPQTFPVSEAPEWVQQAARRVGVRGDHGRYVVRESVLSPGETAGALGGVVRREGSAAGLALVADEEGEVIVTDQPSTLGAPPS